MIYQSDVPDSHCGLNLDVCWFEFSCDNVICKRCLSHFFVVKVCTLSCTWKRQNPA